MVIVVFSTPVYDFLGFPLCISYSLMSLSLLGDWMLWFRIVDGGIVEDFVKSKRCGEWVNFGPGYVRYCCGYSVDEFTHTVLNIYTSVVIYRYEVFLL